MSLNECQIKRQSTKNATESTVSLGEKLADLGPAQVFARFSQNLVRVGSSSGRGPTRGFENFSFHHILKFTANYILHPIINFSRFIFSIFEFLVFR